MDSGKKIIITGTGGFLGSRLFQKFKSEYDVFAPDRKQMDITSKDAVIAYMRVVRPQYMIHCAAVSDIGQCENNPERSYEINVKATGALSEVCSELGTKMIFCSSDQVYLKNKIMLPHSESEDVFPPHHYGKQKREAEKQLLHNSPDAVCLRLSWMYDVKKMKTSEHGNLFLNIVHSLEQRETMSYPVFDHRCITNVWEVAVNMEQAIQLPGGIYNFGSPNSYSTYELVEKMLNYMGADVSLLKKNETAFLDEPRNLCMDISKVQNYGISFCDSYEGFEKALSEFDG